MATRRRSRSSSKPRKLLWVPAVIDPTNITQNNKVVSDLLAGIALDELGGQTVRLVHGTWAFSPVTADLDAIIAFTLYVAPREDFASAPPETQLDPANIMHWNYQFAQVGETLVGENKWYNFPVKTGTMRKLDHGKTLIAMLENLSSENVSTEAAFGLRVLLSS